MKPRSAGQLYVRPQNPMAQHIPGHEHFISTVSQESGGLTVRLVSGHDANAETGAFELSINATADVGLVAEYFGRERDCGNYLYTFERGDSVVITNESGEEIELASSSVQCRLDGLNREELANALTQSRSWYEQEHQAHRRTSERLQHVSDLAYEQLRRLDAKMKNHDENSPAGVLYSQHMRFLERLLRVTEA
jgi:hypothetical protein